MTHLKLEESERLAALLTAVILIFLLFGCRMTPRRDYHREFNFTCEGGHLKVFRMRNSRQWPISGKENFQAAAAIAMELDRACEKETEW